MLQKGDRLRKSAPWPPNMSDGDVSRIVPVHATCIFADPLQKSHAFKRPTRHATLQMKLLQNPDVWLIFGKVLNPLRLPRVIFLKSSTSKSAPKGVHFFQRLNYQQCSNNDFFFTSKCASRRIRAQSMVSHSPRWLCTRCFSEPTFRPSGASKHWNNTVLRLRDVSTRSCALIFFLITDSFSSDSFSSLTLPTSAFPCVHAVGSLTSRFPSIFFLGTFSSLTLPTTVAASVHMSEVWLSNFLPSISVQDTPFGWWLIQVSLFILGMIIIHQLKIPLLTTRAAGNRRRQGWGNLATYLPKVMLWCRGHNSCLGIIILLHYAVIVITFWQSNMPDWEVPSK